MFCSCEKLNVQFAPKSELSLLQVVLVLYLVEKKKRSKEKKVELKCDKISLTQGDKVSIFFIIPLISPDDWLLMGH